MHALRVLEFTAVLEALAEHCDSEPGRVAALALSPAWIPAEVRRRVETTEEADSLLLESKLSMSGLHDLERQLALAAKGAVTEGEALYRVATSLRAMRAAGEEVQPRASRMPRLALLASDFPELPQLESRLLASLDGDGWVKDEASVELAALRKRKASLAHKIQERIQSYVTGPTRNLLSDAVVTQRDGRYVVPLKAENKGKIKGIVHDSSASGSTLYVEPEPVVALGNELRQAEAQERAEVERILRDLSSRVGAESDPIRRGIAAGASFDLVLACARHGQASGGVVPTLSDGPILRIREARHPLLERSVCVPLSVEIEDGLDVLLITGPNTGGKTVAIKTVGLAVAMAQSGMMPPAKSVTIGCFSQLWADIGDEQSLQQSLSTFSGHIKTISQALTQLKPGALVLLDEVGAGTDPAEGAALARAVLLALQKGGAKVMASTHYGELKLVASNTDGFLNASMEFDLKSLRPTYTLLVGVPGSSHAFEIAARYNVPQSVLEEAARDRTQDDLDVARLINELATAKRQAQKAQSEADRLATELRAIENEARRKVEQAEQARSSVRERAANELEELLRAIRVEALDIFDELKKAPGQRGLDRARQRLKELQEVGSDFVRETKPVAKPAAAPQASKAPVTKGCRVTIAGLSQSGVVLDEPKGGQVMVQAGPLKMTCKLKDLVVVDLPAPAAPKSRTGAMTLGKALSASVEIHLRQMRAEDAQHELDKFLDESVLAGLPSVRIVHGKGEGVLRKVTHDTLRKHKAVRSFREGDAEEGGAGVTIALLK